MVEKTRRHFESFSAIYGYLHFQTMKMLTFIKKCLAEQVKIVFVLKRFVKDLLSNT